MDDSIFRQTGPGNVPRGVDNKAVDADPSELSGRTAATRPIWESFVTNTVAQENNRAAVQAEQSLVRSAVRQASQESWKGADGKLLRKVGRQSELLDAEAFTDHPVAGPEARRSLWDRDVRSWRKDASDAKFELSNPAFHAGALTDREREEARMEADYLPDGDARKGEIQAKLSADDAYRARKAQLAQRSFDSEKRARELESTDPETWWSSRGQQPPSQQRAGVVADAQARASQADMAADSASKELADIDARLSAGVRGSEVDALKARRAEIASAQAIAAQEKAKAGEQIKQVQQQAQEQSEGGSDFLRGAEVSLRQIPQLGYGVAGLIGDTMEKTIGVGASLRDWGLKGYKDAEEKAAPLQRENDDVTKAWAKAKSGDVGALVDWAQYGLGYALGQVGETLAVSALGGIAGAAAGSETGPGAAVTGGAGAVAGVVAKGEVKSLAKGLIEKAIASQATKIAARELAKDGVEATAEAITKKAADAVIRKAAAKEIGSNVAVMGNALGMELGSIYPEAVSQAQSEGRELSGTDLARVWGTGLAAGGIEGLTDKLGIDILKGKFADVLPGGRLAGAAVGGLADAAVEGGTEFVQTGIERLGAGQSLTDEDAVNDYINSAAMGAIGGAAVGSVGGLSHGGEQESGDDYLERLATDLAALDPEAAPPTAEELAAGLTLSPQSPADGILIERELAQIEAEDEQAANDSLANVEAVRATGDTKAIKAAEEGAAKVKPRAPLVRAVVKIASGWQADDLTAAEREAVGIVKDDSGGFSIMDAKELADAGISSPMVDTAPDGSLVITDGALKQVEGISPRARSLVKMSEAEAIQKAKQRISTDTQNGAQGEPATGVFSPPGGGPVVSPHETNAAVGSQPTNDNEQQNQIDSGSPKSEGVGFDPIAGQSGTEAGSGFSGDNPGSIGNAGGEGSGQLLGGNEGLSLGTAAHTHAKARFAKAKKKLKDRLNEGTERASTYPDRIVMNPRQIVDEALAGGMTEKQAADYFDRVLDEEIRHLAQFDAARALYRANNGTGDLRTWMESHYAAIWQSDFVATGKDTIIRDLYANSQAEWDAMSDGDKALEAIRMMSQGDAVTEQGKLWANITESLRQAITAAIAALKQFRDIASPTLKTEITNLENALRKLQDQPRAGTPKTGGQKPAGSQKGAGTGGKAEAERDSGAGGASRTEPERRDGAGSPLVAGAKVEFTKDGKTRTGVVVLVQGGNVAIRPDDNPAIGVGVDAGDVRVIQSPATPAENQTPTTPKADEKDQRQGQGRQEGLLTPTAGEKSPVGKPSMKDVITHLNTLAGGKPTIAQVEEAMAMAVSAGASVESKTPSRPEYAATWIIRFKDDNGVRRSGQFSREQNGRSVWFGTEPEKSPGADGAWTPDVQKQYRKLKTALNKAIKEKDWPKVIEEADRGLAYFEANAYPDDWSSWERAKDDAETQIRLAQKTDIGNPILPLSAAEKELGDIMDGLFSSTLPDEEFDRQIPPEKMAQIATWAMKYRADDGVETAEQLAARLAVIYDGRMKPFSQALWFGFKMTGAKGPSEPNWAGIYASLNQDATNENGPRTDAGAGEAPSGDGEAGLGENSMRLAHQIAMRIKRKEKISIQQLTELATGIFGGRTGEAFEIKTAYDAVEMAINILIMDSKIEVKATGDQALKNIDQIREWLEYIPTQTRRTGEMDALQQFSTPPHFSYVASWVAAIRKNDNGLEPSSGLGGLAAWMERGGAVVQLNELSDRRREMLDALHIGPPATNHDAGLIHAIMLPDINSGKMPQPTVVVMNPPFSNNAAGRKDLLTGAKHIEEALKLLPPGGRLVAIVGEGMALEAPAYRGWWDKIRASNDVRANIKVDGSEYRKYGTTFSNRILVIDKVPPTGNPIVGGEVAKIDDLIPLLDGVRTTRPNQNATSGLSSNPPASDQQGGNAQDEQGGNDPGDVSGSPDPGAGTANPNTTRSGGKRGGNGTRSGRGGRTGGGNGNAGSGDVTAANPNDAAEGSGTSDSGGTPAVTNSEVERETIDADADRQIDGEEVFADYRPTFFRLKGAVKHPTTLVESSVMATTELPKSTVTLNLPQETVTSGALSDAQLEAIAYAAQAHETVFENGDRQGFFIGDGTGVGKGREIAGTILNNFREGRRKAVWISEKEGLSKDARRDLDGIGGKEIQVHEMVKKINRPPGDGVAFLTYDGLKNGFDGIDQEGKIRASNDKPSRIKTLLDWLGSDFDGVIALDEVHNAGNVIPIKGPRGYTDPSKKALAVVDLQKVFPNARVLYVSATGATEPNNLAFASRLGLWGIGKAFDRAEKFYTEIKSAGLSAMEIVARDLKSMGLYMARTLSFKGVNGGDPVGFDRLEHQLTPDQEEIYRKAAEGWQTIFTNLDLALDSTGAGRSASAKSAASSAFWGSQQRFFNGLLTAMQMPTALKDMKRRMEEGGSIVIQLINTNEAALDRAIDRALRENPENPDYETVDLSSRQDILDYIFNSFPVQQFHEVSDGEYADGRPKTKWVPLTRPDADGNPIPVLNPEAVAARDQLLEEIATLPLPDPPLEQLFNTFGAEAVAEITGRSRRLVRKTDDQGITRRILETGRGKPKIEKEKNDFLDGKRRILVFSDAGGTGFSYHAGANFKNQQKRYQYVVQAGWRADKAIQGLGRTHRADQVKTPHFLLVSTNVSGHKRFISTIARRLQQLGALTSGERKTTGQGLFNEDDNLEDAYAELAVRRFFNDLYRGAVAGMNFTNVSERLGYVKTVNGEPVNTLVNEDGSLNSEKIPPLKQFLNRILALPIGEQNATFEAFINRRAAFVEQAKENGSYDSGVETFIADEPKINRDEVVFEDPNSSASTRLVELGYKRYFNYNTFDFVKDWAKNPKWVASRDGKRIYALGQTDLTITEDDGRVLPAYRRFSIKSASTETQEKYSTGPRPGKAKIGDKFMVAGAEWELISIDTEEKRARIRQVGTEREKFASSTYELEELFEQTGNIVPGVNDNSNYVPEYFELTEDEAKGEWERVLAEEPKFEERASTFIVGSTLPVWHRIPFYFKQVKRVTLEDGKSFLGVIVPDDKIDQTRNQLGAAAAGVTPARVIDAIINRKSQVELSNGWMMKFTKSAGEDRIEVVGPDLEWSKGTYPRWDSYGFIERINFRPRFFIQPELKDIDRLLRYAPGMRIIESGDALQAATLPATARADSPEWKAMSKEDRMAILEGLQASDLPPAQPFYSQLSRTLEAKMPKSSTPAQVLQIAQGGSKAEEIKWSGLVPKLQSMGPKVDKAELLAWLADEGSVRLEEVTNGEFSEYEVGGETYNLETDAKERQASMVDDYLNDLPAYEYGFDWDEERMTWYVDDETVAATGGQYDFRKEEEGREEFTSPEVYEAIVRQSVDEGFPIEKKEGDTKFGQYTLPGGENYREVVLAMPEPQATALTPSESAELYQLESEAAMTLSDSARARMKELRQLKERNTKDARGRSYTSSHFPDVPNYVAHMRLNERTDADGKPGLFVEEFQSDRHQAGRKSGYKGEFAGPTVTDKTDTQVLIDGRWTHRRIIEESGADFDALKVGDSVPQMADQNIGVPDAPYRASWPLALFKRALRDAVAGNKAWIGWTTGETQNDRFDLGRQVDSLNYGGSPKEGWTIQGIKNGEGIMEMDVEDAKLEDAVGKDVAQRIRDGVGSIGNGMGSLSGLDLKVGGSGMKGFYDNMLPKEIGKYVKQWGGVVQKSELPARDLPEGWEAKWNEALRTNDRATLDKMDRDHGPAAPIWRIDITDAMRKGVEKGEQPLFASQLPPSRKPITINRELAANTRDLQARFGKNVASGKLASFGNRQSRIEQDIIDAQYEFEKARKTNEDAMKVGKKRLETSRSEVEEKLFKAAAGEDVALDAADEMAFRYLINERSEQAGDDIEKHLENGRLRMALRLQRADLARRMQIGYDRLMTPEQRAVEALSAAIYTPSGKVERYAEKLPASKRQEYIDTAMRERLDKVEKELRKLGVTLGQVTGQKRDLQLANSKLDREIKRLRNVIDQGVIKMVQQGASLADIKRRWKVDGEQAKEILTKAREEARVKLRAMYQSGMTPEQIRAALKDGLKASDLPSNNSLTPDEIERLIEEHLVNDLGYIAPENIPAAPIARTPRKKPEKAANTNPLTSDWSRPIFKRGMDEFEFDTKDREAIMERVEVIRGLAGALGKIDGLTGETRAKAITKLQEINTILAKYGTDAAGIFAAEQGIEEYGFDINDVAQVAAVSRAISMIDADIVDKASEWLYFSMLSGLQTMMVNATAAVPAAWESTVGRGVESAINWFLKNPMSADMGEAKYVIKALRPSLTRAFSNARTAFAAQHPMFDIDVLAQNPDWTRIMGGHGYRVGGSISGKAGDRIRIPMRILTATDDFNTTLMACVEVGTIAYRIAKSKGMKPGSAEFNKFIEDEVNKPGSFSYMIATEKAKSAIFSNPLPGQHDPVTGKKVPVRDLGDAVGYLAGKMTDTFAKEHDNLFVKTAFAAMRIAFFPFQRTPFNILRKGVRYTLNPFSLFDIALGITRNAQTADGKWQWKIDKGEANAMERMMDRERLIRRAAMQLQGAMLMLMVAGFAEGDEDDQDKPLVITGSAPFSPRGQAEREAAARSGLGPYRFSFRRKDGTERFGFSYGRLEPLATTLAASIDLMKSVKRSLRSGGDATDAASAAMGGFIAQAQDKSFLKGVGDFVDLATNALAEPDLKDNRKMQQFLAGRVAMVMPNIIRQPIRESDENFRERSANFVQELLYQTVPYGQKPAKVDPYGQPVTKPGTAMGRVVDVTDAGTDAVNPVDRMLLRFRDKNPGKAWFPSVINSAEFTNRKTGKSEKMTPTQLAEFKDLAGKRLAVALKSTPLNIENPTELDVERAKKLVTDSRSDAKKLLSIKYSR